MEKKEGRERLAQFCQTYLQTMDPIRSAETAGMSDGFTRLAGKATQSRLDTMRAAVAEQIHREDAVRRLAQLAFGQSNDAVFLALHPERADPYALDLSAVSECKVTDKGGVEIKFVDRIRALESLCSLLADGGGQSAAELFRALSETADDQEGSWEHG